VCHAWDPDVRAVTSVRIIRFIPASARSRARGRDGGAGPRLSGVLERSTPPNALVDDAGPDGETTPPAKGRGALPKRAVKRIKGHTVYLTDDLFERIMVHAFRKGRTISEYVAGILERQVPDHRAVRPEPLEEAATEPPAA
jgi:hypothetical protein